MSECTNCRTEDKNDMIPHIIINIKYYDNRVNEDNSNYIDEVKMDSEE